MATSKLKSLHFAKNWMALSTSLNKFFFSILNIISPLSSDLPAPVTTWLGLTRSCRSVGRPILYASHIRIPTQPQRLSQYVPSCFPFAGLHTQRGDCFLSSLPACVARLSETACQSTWPGLHVALVTVMNSVHGCQRVVQTMSRNCLIW